ncbi:MAG TPA: squalene--hopene cyclase [Steroidobacteraceae bacterium]|nr:squalene--hopene cyclase [Steroidobacteraceae bacterium]
MSRVAPKPGGYPAPHPDARGDIVAHSLRRVSDSPLDHSVAEARDALIARQSADGHWLFELEADSTIPAEYIMMMHFLDEIDAELETKIAAYLRAHQQPGGGWPLYHGGDFNLSCSIKAYYALKLAGESPDVPHMVRARAAILAHGGAACANVFTRIALALFGQLPWRGVPYIPVEIMLLPRWFPFHLDRVAYWSRTVMVPLFILCTRKPAAKNPRNVDIRELFTTPPEHERRYFRRKGFGIKAFLLADRLGRLIDPLIPARVREAATRRAEAWVLERLNGEDGLGAIFPAMVNALEAMVILGYPEDNPHRATAKRALQKLLVVGPTSAYCQPCVSPVWDTALAALAMQAVGDEASAASAGRSLDWLAGRQLFDEPADWQVKRPALKGGGWAFQYANPHYPDLDDTAAVAWAMRQAAGAERYSRNIQRAVDWLIGMQSANGGFAAFDADNTHYYLNAIPFADHGALLDPPTSDVTARVVTLIALLGRAEDAPALERAIAYLREEQEQEGSWLGRWGTNHIYGTWSVLTALAQAGIGADDPTVRRAADWLESKQNADGGWGESNDTYAQSADQRGSAPSTPFQTAWAMLGLLAAGRAHSETVGRGAEFLIRTQSLDGLWADPTYTAPGFPRVFYLRYHGYSAYFPLWALAAYRTLSRRGISH